MSLVEDLLRSPRSGGDPDLCRDAVLQTIVDLAEAPHKYDPSRKSLYGYLRMSAMGDMLNLLRKQRGLPVVSLDSVAKGMAVGKSTVEDLVITKMSDEEVQKLLAQARRELLDDEEWLVLQLMLDKVRDAQECVAILGWEHDSGATRRVYRLKDRVRKKVARYLEKRGFQWLTGPGRT